MGAINNPNSHLTAKERDRLSFPARMALERGWLKGRVLDLGCGFGSDVRLLQEKKIDITGFDPWYFPQTPQGKFDTILCFYVLNVLLPEQQAAVLMDVSSWLQADGHAYYAVRRDLRQDGYRLHRLHQQQTYQCTVKLPFKSVFRNENCELYEYRHYTTLHQGKAEVSPFFALNEPRELIAETATAFAIYDKFPVNPGHALVIPKRVTEHYFDLSLKEQTACWILVNRVRQIIESGFQPDGFNVGINVLEAAGQTVPHVHIHVIPRYKGDVAAPRGGVRGVVPDKRDYSEIKL